MSEILVPVSFGELLDKIAILEIKRDRMSDPVKVANVRRELETLEATWRQAPASRQDVAELRAGLRRVNEELWDIEDAIRIREQRREFDAEFIRLARAVYFTNDERARLKRELNTRLGSAYVEEKQYVDYRGGTTPPAT